MTKKLNPARLLLLVIVPAVLMTMIVSLSLILSYSSLLDEQYRDYGRATAAQLSDQFAAYIVSDDILSINVLASRLAETDYIAFLAIYDADNTLMTQSGSESGREMSFTHEITFQDSLVGFVRVTPAVQGSVSPLIYLSWLIALVLIAAFAYWAQPILGKIRTPVQEDPSGYPEDGEAVQAPDATNQEECILVVRIRPARYLENHFDRFFKAAGLYDGIVEQTTTEELVIHFEDSDALYKATCTGRLMQALAVRLGGKISFGGTLNLLEDDPEKIRKSASYLASIAGGELLLSGNADSLRDRVELQTFHHSLVDSPDVRRVAALSDLASLDAQVEALSAG